MVEIDPKVVSKATGKMAELEAKLIELTKDPKTAKEKAKEIDALKKEIAKLDKLIGSYMNMIADYRIDAVTEKHYVILKDGVKEEDFKKVYEALGGVS